MSYQSRNAAANSPVILVIGFSERQWTGLNLPFDLSLLGAPGCSLYISVDRTLPAMSDQAGQATARLRIPDDTGLIGRTYYSQFVAIDPSANLLGLTTSNAMIATIGNHLP